MSRRDGKSRMPWSVKGVSTEARELAKSATSRDGDTMGEWLSDVIRRVGAAQAAGRPVGAAGQRRPLPMVPVLRTPHELRGAAGRSGQPPAAPRAEPPPPPDMVDEEALAALVAERVERSEARLVGLLQSLEDVVARLAGRLDRLEAALDEGDPADGRGHPPSLPGSGRR